MLIEYNDLNMEKITLNQTKLMNSELSRLATLLIFPQCTNFRNLQNILFRRMQKFVVVDAGNPVSAVVEGTPECNMPYLLFFMN